MRVRAIIFLAAVVLVGAVAPAAEAREKPAAPPSGSGRWIVSFKASAGSVDVETDRRERARGFRAGLRFRHVVRGFAARLTAAQVAALRADPEVAAVVPDRPRHVVGAVVAGQTVPAGVRRVGAATMALARGAATSAVAVVDTGIDLDHPDLDAAPGTDCTATGSPDDDHGHGTHVAGTIAARNGAGGVVGVAPGTKTYAVKVLDAGGSGSDSSVICGLDWVTAHAAALDIGVVNMSLGGLGVYSTCGDDTDALHEAVCRTVAAGIPVVVAAGNDGWDFGASPPDTPAWYPEVLTVTAMSDGDGLAGGVQAPGCPIADGAPDDAAAGFSNFAALQADSAHTVAAPGVCVLSTYRGGQYAWMNGTSMAAPHIAGLVALCLGEEGAAGPCAGMTPAQVADKLRADAAQATALGLGFSGDPLQAYADRYYGHLARATVGEVPAPEPAPEPTPAAPPAPPAEAATPPVATPPAPAPTCRVHRQVRRHVHRRVHRHRRAGRLARRHVHRRVHVHRTLHIHCG